MAVLTTKDKEKAAATAEKKVAASKKARVAAEKRSSELEIKLGVAEQKLAEATSLNIAREGELVNLKATLKAYENKWYNEGFADAENSVEPVILEAKKLGFEEGWLAALQALGVLEDSPLRNSGQIPFSSTTQAVQNPPRRTDEEETTSMRELLEQIDSHVELVDVEVSSNPHVGDQPDEDLQLQSFMTNQQPPETATQTQPTDLSV